MKSNKPVFVLLLLVFVSVSLAGCFGTTMPKNLVEHGVLARATILDVSDTGWTVNDDPAVKLHLRVEPSDRAPFEATIDKFLVSRISIPSVQPGNVIAVRFDPKDPTIIAVDRQGPIPQASADNAPADAGASLEDRVRIAGAEVVQLKPHYPVAPLPVALQGLRVLGVFKVEGQMLADQTAAKVENGCRQSNENLLVQMGWVPVRDSTQAHDLVSRGECTASAKFLSTDSAMYVLLPHLTTGLRLESASGDLVEQLLPMATTFKCPDTDQSHCATAIKEYAVSQRVDQIAHSVSLANYVARLHGSKR